MCTYAHIHTGSPNHLQVTIYYTNTRIHAYITLHYRYDARVRARNRGARTEMKSVNTAAIANSFRLNWIPRRIFAKDAYFIEMAIRADDSHRHKHTQSHICSLRLHLYLSLSRCCKHFKYSLCSFSSDSCAVSVQYKFAIFG